MTSNRFRMASCLVLLLSLPVWAEFPGSKPFPGITYEAETRSDPPMRLFVVKVDLTNPAVSLHVAPGGPDPDGDGEWETTLMTPTSIAARERFDVVINGDFFGIRRDKDAGSSPGYRRDVWAGAIGPATSNGKTWSVSKNKRPCLVVRKNGRASIEMVDRPPADAREVISGNTMLVERGKVVPQNNKDRHPRTVVGLDREGKTLTILIVDGRRPGVSVGMRYEELAQEMWRLGCWDAVNLDGGGSTVLAMRKPDSRDYVILNTPSDGRERPVANVLGIRVKPSRSTARRR